MRWLTARRVLTRPPQRTAPAEPAADGAAEPRRNRYFDLLRFLALVRVVIYHASPLIWLKWFPSMGIMFALAGALMVRSIDRSAGQAVSSRLRRLLPVLWIFAAIWVPVMLWHDGHPAHWVDADGSAAPTWQLVFWLLPIGNPPGSQWGVIGWGVLWYIKTYLLYVLLSPVLLPLFRRAPWVLLSLPFAVLALVETEIITVADWWGRTIKDFLTYLGCWLVGFAAAEGVLKRTRLPVLLAIGAAFALAGIAWLLGPGNDGAAASGASPWSLLNSDLAIGLFYCGAVLVLMRFSLPVGWLARAPVLDRAVTIFNARAVTIFLWHGVALAGAIALVGSDAWFLWFPLAWAFIGAAIVLFGWLEDFAARRTPVLVPAH
ncbi:acyltransferase family protein [Cryptosporangium minutisporangium]|uniref:Acyltransferase n=1 Tax=Cryptosporangium minutisporangium TaxID=113569 RepID=A0ABP6T2R1_9ACTN